MPTLMLIHPLHIITTKVITGFPDTLCRSLCILCLRALLARACPSSSYKVQQFHHTHAIILRTSYVRDTSDPLKLVRLPSFHTMSKSFVPDINPARRSCCRCPNPSCLILIPHEGPVVTSPSFTYVPTAMLTKPTLLILFHPRPLAWPIQPFSHGPLPLLSTHSRGSTF